MGLEGDLGAGGGRGGGIGQTQRPLLSSTHHNGGGGGGNNNSNEKGSMDSSDTFQSCQTHPYLSSQEDVLDGGGGGNNLYVNPFNSKGSTGSLFNLNPVGSGLAAGVGGGVGGVGSGGASSGGNKAKVRKSGSGEFLEHHLHQV